MDQSWFARYLPIICSSFIRKQQDIRGSVQHSITLHIFSQHVNPVWVYLSMIMKFCKYMFTMMPATVWKISSHDVKPSYLHLVSWAVHHVHASVPLLPPTWSRHPWGQAPSAVYGHGSSHDSKRYIQKNTISIYNSKRWKWTSSILAVSVVYPDKQRQGLKMYGLSARDTRL